MTEVGDRIRIAHHPYGYTTDHSVEEFRQCLGIFMSTDDRIAQRFTPLCNLYEVGADSIEKYLPNYGSYHTNMVQAWMDLPTP